jgi:hypothetical protein
MSGVERLAAVIACHLQDWRSFTPHVELAIFSTDDPVSIAGQIDAFCRRELGSAVEDGFWHQSSVGAVSALKLDDGRRVVVKGHQPERQAEWLREVVRVQTHLASRGCYATAVCAGPAPLGRGLAVVETLVDAGSSPDAHQPAIRRAMAQALREIFDACRTLVEKSTLKGHLLSHLSRTALWPEPHSKLFDFEATAAGAEWIDSVAMEARSNMAPVGELVIGHGDWRAEHVRFVGTKLAVAFDWDSLCKEHESFLAGLTALQFCADFSRSDGSKPAPTLDEARAFVSDYEVARGRAFDAEERRQCAAAFAYTCAYIARCEWALGVDQRGTAGSFQGLLASEGSRLLVL